MLLTAIGVVLGALGVLGCALAAHDLPTWTRIDGYSTDMPSDTSGTSDTWAEPDSAVDGFEIL